MGEAERAKDPAGRGAHSLDPAGRFNENHGGRMMAIRNLEELSQMIAAKKKAPVYFLFSPDEYLLSSFAGRLFGLLAEEGEQPTVIPGPQPEMGQVVEAAGAISLFGTKRLVYLNRIEPTTMKADDVKLLAELMTETENAVLVLTMLIKEPERKKKNADRSPVPAAAKPLLAAAEKAGVAALLERPNEAYAKRFVCRHAQQLGAAFDPAAAEQLVRRCGLDLFLLSSEVEKLAAASGYGTISEREVFTLSPRSIEADVFEMVRLLLAGRGGDAMARLNELLYLQNAPIAIAAAINGSFVDMVRVRAAAEQKIGYQQAFRDMGNKGNDYRYKKSLETARNFSTAQLAAFIEILDRLDRKLKGSAVDKNTLLQMAMGEILLVGRGDLSYANS